MFKVRVGSRLVFWLPVLCLALAPAIGTVDDAAAPALEAPAAAPSEVAALLPANTPPTLKALGGTLTIIWGNGGLVSASSKDAGVASAAASGSEIAITGVSSGETRIVARTSGGECHVPVRVGGGG